MVYLHFPNFGEYEKTTRTVVAFGLIESKLISFLLGFESKHIFNNPIKYIRNSTFALRFFFKKIHR